MDDPPLLLDPSHAPVLLFDCGRGGVEPEEATDDARLVYSIPKKQVLLARGLDGFIDDVSWITPQGWVLRLDPATRDVSQRDPFPSRRVRLPPDPDGLLASSDDTRCVMSTHRPTDPGCVVLVIHQKDPVLCYCRPGGSQWFRHEYQPELLVVNDSYDRYRIIEEMVKLTAVEGRFYAYFRGADKMATLEFSPDPTLSSFDVMRWPWSIGCYRNEACPVESCGELFMVRFCYTQLCDRTIWRVEAHVTGIKSMGSK